MNVNKKEVRALCKAVVNLIMGDDPTGVCEELERKLSNEVYAIFLEEIEP